MLLKVVTKSRGDNDKKLSEKEYLSKIRPYLIDMINDHKDATKRSKSAEWKIRLCMYINFISSKDTGETRNIYAWSDNTEIVIGNKTDDIIKELFESFLNNYQKEEQIMRGGSDFIFESV